MRRSNPVLDPSTTTYHAAVLLLAAGQVGQNVDKLSRFTGYPREFVARCARRLYDNGVWKGGRTEYGWSLVPSREDGFWSDVAVAEGRLCRRIDESGSLQWFPTGTRGGDEGSPPPFELHATRCEDPDEKDVEEVDGGSSPAPKPAVVLAPVSRAGKLDLFPDAVWLT